MFFERQVRKERLNFLSAHLGSALQVMLTKESNPIKGVLIDSRATIDGRFRLSYSQLAQAIHSSALHLEHYQDLYRHRNPSRYALIKENQETCLNPQPGVKNG
jgi:hypothetical protein